MKLTGKTTDQKDVYGDVFLYVGTHGIPLEIVLGFIKNKQGVVDWLEYIQSSLNDGHKIRTIKAKILSAIGEVYGNSYKKEFEKRLNHHILG